MVMGLTTQHSTTPDTQKRLCDWVSICVNHLPFPTLNPKVRTEVHLSWSESHQATGIEVRMCIVLAMVMKWGSTKGPRELPEVMKMVYT